MRVLLAANSYLPAIGGVERYLSELARTLLGMGHRVDVLCQRQDASCACLETLSGSRVVRHPEPDLPGYLFPLRPAARRWAIAETARFVFRNAPDIVISRFPAYTLALKSLFPNTPIVHVVPTVSGIELTTDLGGAALSMKEKCVSRLMVPAIGREELNALNAADRIVTFSENVKTMLMEEHGIPQERIEVIQPGVDTEKFRPAICPEGPPEEIRDLASDPGSRKILFTGRLKHMKGADLALEAFAVASRQLSSIGLRPVLVVLGDGPEKAGLAALAEKLDIGKACRFLPATKTIAPWYPCFDLLIHTSRLEPFGHVILEAMASGLPVLSLKSSPPDFRLASEEIINDGITGFLVSPQDPTFIGSRLAQALSDLDDLKMCGARAREFMISSFNWELHARRLIGMPLDQRSESDF